MSYEKQPNSRYCFVCGIENPLGLNVAFWQDGAHVVSRVVLTEPYQGYPGVAHGGVVTALLDEAMGRAIIGQGGTFAFTARMELKFHRPVQLDTPLLVRARIVRTRQAWFFTEGEVVEEASGARLASAEATFAHLPDEQVAAMSQNLDFWEVVPDASTHHPPTPVSQEGDPANAL